MLNAIEAGRIFVRHGTALPKDLQLESELYTPSWRVVERLDGYGLGRKIRDAGWTFFYLAYETKASVFGMDAEKTVRRAIERILASREAEKFNSLEIVRVASLASRRFLGIRHVTVSARPRHIQESPVIFQVKNKNFEAPSPSKIDPGQSIGMSTRKEPPSGEIKRPNFESARA